MILQHRAIELVIGPIKMDEAFRLRPVQKHAGRCAACGSGNVLDTHLRLTLVALRLICVCLGLRTYSDTHRCIDCYGAQSLALLRLILEISKANLKVNDQKGFLTEICKQSGWHGQTDLSLLTDPDTPFELGHLKISVF